MKTLQDRINERMALKKKLSDEYAAKVEPLKRAWTERLQVSGYCVKAVPGALQMRREGMDDSRPLVELQFNWTSPERKSVSIVVWDGQGKKIVVATDHDNDVDLILRQVAEHLVP